MNIEKTYPWSKEPERVQQLRNLIHNGILTRSDILQLAEYVYSEKAQILHSLTESAREDRIKASDFFAQISEGASEIEEFLMYLDTYCIRYELLNEGHDLCISDIFMLDSKDSEIDGFYEADNTIEYVRLNEGCLTSVLELSIRLSGRYEDPSEFIEKCQSGSEDIHKESLEEDLKGPGISKVLNGLDVSESRNEYEAVCLCRGCRPGNIEYRDCIRSCEDVLMELPEDSEEREVFIRCIEEIRKGKKEYSKRSFQNGKEWIFPVRSGLYDAAYIGEWSDGTLTKLKCQVDLGSGEVKGIDERVAAISGSLQGCQIVSSQVTITFISHHFEHEFSFRAEVSGSFRIFIS